MRICEDLRPVIGCKSHNNGGVESIPFEVKVLACLRHLGRGECWDTIKELCQDLVSHTTLPRFFTRFTQAMREMYEDDMIHAPRTETELESVLFRSAKRGFPGCIGYMDGVHVHWDRCPVQWKHLCTGKNEYPTIGWQCVVNHNRRFMSVSKGQMGSVNDKAACKYDEFVKQLRTESVYKDHKYMVYDVRGVQEEETGLWLNVDGGYIGIPECLVGEPQCLDHYMNFWTTFMESERKHVECAFGILKGRFRILKLPIRMHNFSEIDNMFVTCAILHNMCLDFDGADDGWNLGINGDDGNFSDDENHQFYWSGNMFYDITPDIDYTTRRFLHFPVGTKLDRRHFHCKREKLAQHWYYMYRQGLIDFDYNE